MPSVVILRKPQRHSSCTGGIEEVEKGRDDDDDEHRLHPAHDGPDPHFGDGDGGGQYGHDQGIGDHMFAEEQSHDIQSTVSRILVRGSIRWRTVWPGKYCPSVMSLRAISPHPLSGKIVQHGLPGLLNGIDRGIDLQSHGLQAVEHPGHLGHAQSHGLQFRSVLKDLPGRALEGDLPSLTTTRRSTVRATSSMEWETRMMVA